MKKIALGIATATLLVASPAYAAPLLFNFTGATLTGPVTASFQLDSNPTPSSINDQSIFGYGQVFFNNVSGIF